MRVPRVRFTVRQMMIAVAVVAGLASVEAMRRRSSDLQEHAESHKVEACGIALGIRPDPEHRWEAWIAYHMMLSRKYERAAAHPWLPIAPDPPEPK
jgi:hypothetical protein